MLACLFLAGCGGHSVPEVLVADTVLVNGNVITVDPEDRIVQALAIKNGTDSGRRHRHRGRESSRGRTPGSSTSRAARRLPGSSTLIVISRGEGPTCSRSPISSYPKIKGIDDVLGDVEKQVEGKTGGDWVQGRGWDEGKLEERRYILASDLDPVSGENPVWLTHTMGHYGVANSLALKLANVTKATSDPPGGTIDRYPDGTPTGVLKERAQELVTRLIPELTVEQIQKGIEHIAKEFHKEGMTGLKDPGIGPAEWEAYQRALAAGTLPVRAFILWRAGNSVEEAEELAARIGPFTKPYRS